MDEAAPPAEAPGRGWPRAAALFGVVLAMSVVQPGVLLAVPLLLLLGVRGMRGMALFAAAAIATVILLSGSRDGIWYAERAWAVLVGGCFVGLTMTAPSWRLSSRTLGAVLGATTIGAALVAVRSDAWTAIDWAIGDSVRAGVATTLDALALVRGGEPLSPAIVTAIYETAEAQAEVFPAMVALASMAACCVAWWVYTRLSGGGDQAIGPLRGFRFNDHLVWLMIGGLVLLILRWGDALARLGSNAVVFMGALYALRGAAVFVFLSGGLSLVGYVMFAVGLLFAAPVVLAVAILIGIGDTWLDVRGRASDETTA